MTHVCLDDETIAAFASAALSPAQMAEVERELDVCDECRELVADAARGASEDPATSEVDEIGATVHSIRPYAEPVAGAMPRSPLPERFELEAVAGRGASGIVYRARDVRSGQAVALKLIHGDVSDPERVEREVRLLAELRHPAIVRYVDHGLTPDGRVYVAMEWLEGTTLADRLARGPLSIAETVALGRRVASGLAAMHARGVVHRDIKPSNLLLSGGALAAIKIVDLGIAHEGAREKRLTMTGMLLGTPGYMAPEQARGSSSIDASADVFALGAVLHQALTGQAPFEGNDVLQILIKTVIEEARPPSSFRDDVPRELDDLVIAMLAKEAARRPRDALAVDAALAGVRLVSDGAEPASRALAVDERRLFSLIHVGARDRRLGYRTDVAALASRHGGRLEAMVDGTLVVAHAGSDLLADEAVRAARCALALEAKLSGVAVRLVTGRGRLDSGDRGAVLDRLSRLAPREGAIRIDDVTAGFLDARFVLAPCPHGFELRGERDVGDEERTLLGRPSPCVGRDRELAALEAILAECVETPAARKVLVVGDPGVGKSRVRRELLVRVEQSGRPFEVWTARGDPLGNKSPLSLLSQALLRSAGVMSSDAIEVRRHRLVARVGRNLGGAAPADAPAIDDALRIAAFVGDGAGVPFADDAFAQLRVARADAMVMADQVRRAWLDLIFAELSAGALAIVLEDLHFSDRASVQLLDVAARAFEGLPLAILAFARPDARELFPELTSPGGADEIVLRPLSRRAAEDLVRGALVGAVDGKVARIVELAQGNAFFLEELVRATERGSGAPPETILGVLESRLAELEPRARRVLRAASVVGGVFWTGALTTLLGSRARDADIEASLAELVSAEMISRQRGSRVLDQPEFVFRHALLREAAYATLTDEDKRDLHARAGGWLEANLSDDPLVLAEHFDRGGEPQRAATYLFRGAERALAADDAEVALELVARAFAASRAADDAEPARLGAMHALKAAAHRWRSELVEAEHDALAAMALLAPGGAIWFEAANIAGQVSGRLRHLEVLDETRDRVVAAEPTEPGAAAERVKAIHAMLTQYWVSGRIDAWESLLAIAERATDPRDAGLACRLFLEHGRRAHRSGDLGVDVDHLQRSVDLAHVAGELRVAASHQFNLVNGLIEVGLPERAEAILAGIEKEARGRLPFFSIGVNLFRGRTRMALGDLEGARAALRRAIAQAVETGDHRVEGGARMYLAEALGRGGEWVEGEREAGLAIGLLGKASPLAPRARATLARILVALGRVDEARRAADAAVAELGALAWIEEGESLVRLVHAEVLAAIGDAAANGAFASARENLLARAAKITDAGYRLSFLERVAENAATLARAPAGDP